MKKITVMLAPLFLSGCFNNEIDCNSDSVNKIITNDFKRTLERSLPKGAWDFIEKIELTSTKTLKSDNESGIRECESKVLIHTTNKENAYQNIKYTTYKIENGEHTLELKYSYIDTFNYIAKNTFAAIKQPYQAKIANDAGFSSYKDFESYTNAKNTLRRNNKSISKYEEEIKKLREQADLLESEIEKTKKALKENKTALLTNQYISMEPLTIDISKALVKKFFDNEIQFKTKVKNLSEETFDRFYLNADIFINKEKKAFERNQFSSIALKSGLIPGEERSVVVSVSGSKGIGDNIFRTSAWKDAKSVKIILRPYKYTNGRGKEIQFRKSTFNNSEITITWDKYFKIDRELDYKLRKKEQLEQGIINAQKTISALEKVREKSA